MANYNLLIMRYQRTERVIELTTNDKVIICYHWETPFKKRPYTVNSSDNSDEYDYTQTILKRTEITLRRYGVGECELPFSVVVMLHALYKQIADGYNEPIKPERI